MIIKILFAILVLSAVCLIGVAIAVFVRVRWHLKPRRGMLPMPTTEITRKDGHEGLT